MNIPLQIMKTKPTLVILKEAIVPVVDNKHRSIFISQIFILGIEGLEG